MVKSIVASYESQEKNGHKFRFSINLRRKLSSENFCRKRQDCSTAQGPATSNIRCWNLGSRIERASLVLNGFVDLAAMDCDILGGLDAKTNLVTPDLDHGHRDVVVDNDAFVLLAGENQHRRSSLMLVARRAYHPRIDLTCSQVMAECTRPLDSCAHFALVKMYKMKQGGQGDRRFFLACRCFRRSRNAPGKGPLRCFFEHPKR